MVADCFLPPRPSLKHQIRHLDGNQHNDIDTNLKWGTAKENAADREAHGRTAKGERNGASKLTAEIVSKIKEELSVKISQRKIAKHYGVSQQLIQQINAGLIWKDEPATSTPWMTTGHYIYGGKNDDVEIGETKLAANAALIVQTSRTNRKGCAQFDCISRQALSRR